MDKIKGKILTKDKNALLTSRADKRGAHPASNDHEGQISHDIENEPERYFNRELSWLRFNERVLEEAVNRAHPLLERLRFLSISGTNLDEFFMVRVAGLVGQAREGISERSADGMTPKEQLHAIEERSAELIDKQQKIWANLAGELANSGVKVVKPDQLCEAHLRWLEDHFDSQIFRILTPQALDPAHPFPFVPNKGLGMLFELSRLSDGKAINELVLIPAGLSRFIRIPGEEAIYVAIENVIDYFSDHLFPGYHVQYSGIFRVLRDSDIEVEEEAEDLVRYFRSAIQRRRRGEVVRVEMSADHRPAVMNLLRENLIVEATANAAIGGFVGFGDLSALVKEDLAKLKFTPYVPRFPERILEHGGDCFAAIRHKDILVHHPYESFEVVVEFLKQAAADPDVVAIKQTLYRAGRQSAVIRALIDAAEAGKSVTAVIELKARFDEEQNLYWAKALERAGVQVVYGFIEWKTHAKMSMVIRRESDGYRSYCHFGTGNYHPVTTRIYTDLSVFTADAAIARDAVKLFNYITGYVDPERLEHLSMSPRFLRDRIYSLIDEEIINAKAGRPAMIWAKMNSLVDPAVIEKLYEASNAGVEIELVVRGICCLRPGVTGMSENIRVKSVIGRFLEHSRIWAFAKGAALPHRGAFVAISSADWMPRNLDRRMEYMLPIRNKTVHQQILDQVLLANLLDNEQSWTLDSGGTYHRIAVHGQSRSYDEAHNEASGFDEFYGEEDKGLKAFNLHHYFMTNPSLSGRGASLKEKDAVPKLDYLRGGPPKI